ncbi:MAG: ABC transporter permease [Methylacidiphilales bacterium]|nr:ABC transporter permease [Candidatus Methylacidiphilales bacterium]
MLFTLRKKISIGFVLSIPMVTLLLVAFVGPLIIVALYSVMPSGSFDLFHIPTIENYRKFFANQYYHSLFISIYVAFISTVVLLILCYPMAYAMAKIFKKFSLFITVAIVSLLFISEGVRLYGWVIILMKGGLLDGYLQSWFGASAYSDLLYNTSATIFGLIYNYFPFMLFPLVQSISGIPEDLRDAARDLGASSKQLFFQIDLPLAMPGIIVGSLLTFVFSIGSMAEAEILGGKKVIMINYEVQNAFSYAQNWPLGSAVSMMMIACIVCLLIPIMKMIKAT